MSQNITLIVYPVQDIESAKAFYTKFLDVEPYTDSPYYVGYKVGNLEIGLDPNSKVGPIVYTDVSDIKASIDELTQVGAEIVQEPKNVGNGLWISTLKDTGGNVIGLRQETK